MAPTKAIIAALALASSSAWAQDSGGTLSADDLPAPDFEIQRIQPDVSYEFAAHMSFGAINYWDDEIRPYPGLGFRVGAGRNLGSHRLGGGFVAAAEGPVGGHTSLVFEPSAQWDMVADSGFSMGANVGPAIMYHVRADRLPVQRAWTFGPSVAARIGFSQPFSSVGPRMFVYAEPKLRVIDGELSPVVALLVGSGGGR